MRTKHLLKGHKLPCEYKMSCHFPSKKRLHHTSVLVALQFQFMIVPTPGCLPKPVTRTVCSVSSLPLFPTIRDKVIFPEKDLPNSSYESVIIS